ncbi:MAG: choice-of-anchor J domain-containing protein [Chitinophagaceae bacterium]|nr:choice-of-anchor J domain-containing protein [Chitinophagaceae bacterium]
MKKLLLLLVLLQTARINTSAQILLSESFDGATFVPAGWQNIYVIGFGPTVRWDRVTAGANPTVLPHSGAAMARFDCRTANNGYVVNLVTPPLNFSSGSRHRVRFWMYRGDQAPLGTDFLSVFVNTFTYTSGGGAAELSKLVVSRIQDPSEPANGWYEYVCEIPANYNGATNYIIFNANGRNSNNIIYLDDVTVEATSCLRPVTPGYSNLTTNSVQFNWSPPVSGSPTGYDYEIRTAGSAGSGSNGLEFSGSVLTPATSMLATGLQEGYQYNLSVRSDCGTDSSVWSTPVKVVTPCVPRTIPYTENFDGVVTATGLPPCMSVHNVDGVDTWRMNTYYYNSTYTNSAPRAIFANASGGFYGQPGEDWFFTAPLTLEAGKCYQLSFAYRTYFPNESIEVKMGKGPLKDSMTTPIFSRNSFNSTTYLQQANAISVNTSGTYYIGFRCATNQGFSGGLFVDDIAVTEVCGVPSGLQLSNVSLSEVTFNWNAPACGTDTGYEWELRTSGAAGSGATGLAETGLTGAGVLTATSGALVNGTTYSLYVRTKCVAGISGLWTSAVTFKACGTAALPYFENFDGVVPPALPGCYTIENVNGGATWEIRGSIQPFSAPNCMSYTSWATSAIGDDWLYTPPFALTAGTTYRLSFYYGARSTSNIEKLEVKTGVATNASSMNGPLLFSNYSISNPVLTQAIVDFTPTVTSNQHIGFHALSVGPQFFLKLDDINLSVAPLCDSVRKVQFVNITPYAATAQWQAPMVNTVSSYEWELRSSGAPGSGGAGLVQSGTLAGNSLSVPLTGLLPAQTFSFYIRSACGVTNGDWVPAVLTAACLPVVPDYAENFDGVTAPALPACTRIENINKDITWQIRNVGASQAQSSPNVLFYFFNPFMPADDWFYSAPLNLSAGNTYRLSFYYRADNSTYTEALEVKLGSYAQPSAMNTVLYSNTNIRNQVFQLVNIEFTAPAAGTYYLGFRCFSIVNQGGLWLDGISVKSLGGCSGIPLVIPAGRSGSTYQWEINTGSGFTPLSDNANYNGTATSSLSVTGVPTSYYGYQYRCLVDGLPADPFTLKFAASWNGTTDVNWHNPVNWGGCGILPDQYTDVYIPSGKVRYPSVSNAATIRSLTASAGAAVTVQNNVVLEIIK